MELVGWDGGAEGQDGAAPSRPRNLGVLGSLQELDNDFRTGECFEVEFEDLPNTVP